MLSFSVITLFPQMIHSHFQEGVVGQALKKGLFQLETINPRDFAEGIHRTVDDRPFGGGDGMVMLADILAAAVEKQKTQHPQTHIVYLSAQGKPWTAARAQQMAEASHITLICGRYGGLDQRFINGYVDEEISIGDYVLSGGEIPALAVIDATVRFVPGVLGHKASADADSFTKPVLEAPLFTRPEEWRGQVVPGVLTSGHHQKIQVWREQMGELVTYFKRPDMAQGWSLQKREELKKFWMSLSESDKKSCGLPLEW